MSKLRIPPEIQEWFRKTGAMGGKARARHHTPEELSAWGRMGGRPKGSGKKRPTKAAAKAKGGR